MNLKRSEASVKSSVQKLLKARGSLCFRMNSFDQIIVEGKKRRRIMGNPSGTADILVFGRQRWGEKSSGGVVEKLYRIMPLWIECKSSTGKQSREQRQFQELVERENHTYLLVRSADELNSWLNQNFS
jgi:hypothetical protein